MTISTKYIGMDVHKESISIAVRNAAGKIVMESLIETKARMILQFIDGLRGDLHVNTGATPMRMNTQEAVLSAYIASIGKRTPREAAQDAATLQTRDLAQSFERDRLQLRPN